MPAHYVRLQGEKLGCWRVVPSEHLGLSKVFWTVWIWEREREKSGSSKTLWRLRLMLRHRVCGTLFAPRFFSSPRVVVLAPIGHMLRFRLCYSKKIALNGRWRCESDERLLDFLYYMILESRQTKLLVFSIGSSVVVVFITLSFVMDPPPPEAPLLAPAPSPPPPNGGGSLESWLTFLCCCGLFRSCCPPLFEPGPPPP